jgi:hypothetical protein
MAQPGKLIVTVHGLLNEPSRAKNHDLVVDVFAGGSVSEPYERFVEGDDQVSSVRTSPAAETSDPPATAFLERCSAEQEGS